MLARQIAIGFGIAIVFPLLVYYGVASIYTPPKLPAYVVVADAPINPTSEERQHYVEQRRAEQQEQNRRYEAYEAASKDFAGHLIYFATPLGICAIFLGAYLPLLRDRHGTHHRRNFHRRLWLLALLAIPRRLGSIRVPTRRFHYPAVRWLLPNFRKQHARCLTLKGKTIRSALTQSSWHGVSMIGRA